MPSALAVYPSNQSQTPLFYFILLIYLLVPQTPPRSIRLQRFQLNPTSVNGKISPSRPLTICHRVGDKITIKHSVLH